ncbi:hypothetical protein MMC07_000254 [Pseudocyphellaria aurata]|nr:hypothetical protein [Pseudocyphellaria aurata]
MNQAPNGFRRSVGVSPPTESLLEPPNGTRRSDGALAPIEALLQLPNGTGQYDGASPPTEALLQQPNGIRQSIEDLPLTEALLQPPNGIRQSIEDSPPTEALLQQPNGTRRSTEDLSLTEALLQQPNGTRQSIEDLPPTEAQLQPPNGIRQSIEDVPPPSPESSSPRSRFLLSQSNVRTPLGEILNQHSAMILARHPVWWHLVYFIDLSVVAVLRGEDPALMALRIEIEQNNIADRSIRSGVLDQWSTYLRDFRDMCEQNWRERTLASVEASGYLRDLDRMLENKLTKAFSYLHRIERQMIFSLRNADVEIARGLFEKLGELYRKLREEHEADAADGCSRDGESDGTTESDENMAVEEEQGDSEQSEDETGTDITDIRIPAAVITSGQIIL